MRNKEFGYKEDVLKYYPKAKAINIGTKNGGDYWNIIVPESNIDVYGKGKTEYEAWKSAYRNITYRW